MEQKEFDYKCWNENSRRDKGFGVKMQVSISICNWYCMSSGISLKRRKMYMFPWIYLNIQT